MKKLFGIELATETTQLKATKEGASMSDPTLPLHFSLYTNGTANAKQSKQCFKPKNFKKKKKENSFNDIIQ